MILMNVLGIYKSVLNIYIEDHERLLVALVLLGAPLFLEANSSRSLIREHSSDQQPNAHQH
jgi:hypothetical protein